MKGSSKEITSILMQYNIMKAELINKQKVYKSKSKNIGSAVNYSSERSGKTNRIVSETETLAIYLAEYKIDIDDLTLLLEIIDTALNGLTEKERNIVTLKYIDGKPWWKVADELNLSEKWCKIIKKEAYMKLIRSIPIEIFPDIFFS